jgi:hypothetical protein
LICGDRIEIAQSPYAPSRVINMSKSLVLSFRSAISG